MISADREALVHHLEQRVIERLALAQRRLGARALDAREDALAQLAEQLQLAGAPLARLFVRYGQQKLPLALAMEGNGHERDDPQARVCLGVGARVGLGVVDDHRFARAPGALVVRVM